MRTLWNSAFNFYLLEDFDLFGYHATAAHKVEELLMLNCESDPEIAEIHEHIDNLLARIYNTKYDEST